MGLDNHMKIYCFNYAAPGDSHQRHFCFTEIFEAPGESLMSSAKEGQDLNKRLNQDTRLLNCCPISKNYEMI